MDMIDGMLSMSVADAAKMAKMNEEEWIVGMVGLMRHGIIDICAFDREGMFHFIPNKRACKGINHSKLI
jgi:hypothetical protein